ncbi:MAG: PAS domain-containing sensor histidine kinase [Pseudolabrys sp.]|nr:PAS domain-containing sensor histidine kinase [Pseudolabrys sp.]
MSFLTSIRRYTDGLVHPVARRDASAATLHRGFIAPRLLGSLAAMALVPLYLVVRGVPSAWEIALIGCLLVPLALAFYLSRSGRFDAAQMLSTAAALVVVSAAGFFIGATAYGWSIVLAGAVLMTCIAVCVRNAGNLARAAVGRMNHGVPGDMRFADAVPDLITRHTANGDVIVASGAAQAMLHCPAERLAGHGLFDRVHLHDRPHYLRTLQAALQGGDGALEFRLRRDGGASHFLWVEMRCRAVGANGREIIAVLRDISVRKAQEQSVQEARAEAERANAGKSRFLATMSHELRTPLNAIIGFSDMMTNAAIAIDETRRREYARLINESGRHLLSVVNGMLDMSKMDTGNFEIAPEPFVPGPVIAGCCDLLALKAREAGVDLSLRTAAGLPELVADRRALNQILINLISNAIKFTERGGTVTVSATCEGRQLVVAVADNGVGIAEADLPRLGEAFFQARGSYDRRHDGTGLGLSIVKGLVRLHGGNFAVASRLGEGTTVTVTLPLDCEGHRPSAATHVLQRRGPERTNEPIKKSA